VEELWSVSGWDKNFSFLQNIQIGLVAQPAHYSVDVRDVFLGVKLAMA
jgi:hypothetical protein